MKLIDKSAVVAEIEKLKEENKPNSKSISEYIKGGIYGFDLAIEKTLGILDTLEVKEVQEEPVSEELESAAKAYSAYERGDDTEVGYDINRYEGFIAGAEWQKSQGVTKEAVIGITPKEYFISISQSTVDMLDLCAGDKVIVQLRKKEDKI